MLPLQRLKKVLADSARAARELVTEARQVAGLPATGPKIEDTRVETTPNVPTTPTLVDTAQQLGTTAINLIRSRAGQRLTTLLVEVAVVQATRLAVRAALGPLAGNIVGGMVGLAVGMREVHQPAPQAPPTTGTA